MLKGLKFNSANISRSSKQQWRWGNYNNKRNSVNQKLLKAFSSNCMSKDLIIIRSMEWFLYEYMYKRSIKLYKLLCTTLFHYWFTNPFKCIDQHLSQVNPWAYKYKKNSALEQDNSWMHCGLHSVVDNSIKNINTCNPFTLQQVNIYLCCHNTGTESCCWKLQLSKYIHNDIPIGCFHDKIWYLIMYQKGQPYQSTAIMTN